MYFLEGPRLNLENLLVLSKVAQPHLSFKSLKELKRGYNAYLGQFQSNETLTDLTDPEVVRSEVDRHHLITLFLQKSPLNDLGQDTAISFAAMKGKRDAYSQIERAVKTIKSFDPVLGELLCLVINRIFLGESERAGGGSSSGAIGCVWLNPRHNWTDQDFCEFLIHEFTHQLLFIDERRFGHYPEISEVEKPENFARSAILNRERPLDKVVHSLVVAFEVLRFRERYFDLAHKTHLHPQAASLQQSIDLTIRSLRSVPRHLLSERVWVLIESVKKNGRTRFAI